MSSARRPEKPSPTIVGPRAEDPGEAGAGAPNGIERLLTLGGIHEDWRRRILADPLAAAAEAGIDLTGGERTVLASMPRPALEKMIASFGGRPAPAASGLKAAGLAAAALLATAVSAEGGPPPVSLGIQPDIPPNRQVKEKDVVRWIDSLPAAFLAARLENRAVMTVFLASESDMDRDNPPPASRGVRPDAPRAKRARESQAFLLSDHPEYVKAVKDAKLLAVKVAEPVGKGPAHDKQMAEYMALIRRYNVVRKPVVLFLAPDGSVLGRIDQPTESKPVVEAVNRVPPLLAKWIANRRQGEVATPPATDGIRPDVPASKGMRRDVPPPQDARPSLPPDATPSKGE